MTNPTTDASTALTAGQLALWQACLEGDPTAQPARRVLEQGTDPNFSVNGRSPIGYAISLLREAPGPYAEDLVGALLMSGADPMRGGDPFEGENPPIRSITDAYLLLDAAWTCETEGGAAWRAEDGSNLLHWLMLSMPVWAAGWIRKSGGAAWTMEAREDGNTPLLAAATKMWVQWAEKSEELLRAKFMMMPYQVIDFARAMQNAGLPISQRNLRGECATDLISRLLVASPLAAASTRKTWARVLAADQLEQLEQGTATAGAKHATGMRL